MTHLLDIRSGTVRIVAIGDSVIYGRKDAEASGWVTLLRQRAESIDPAAAVFNLGIGGHTSNDVLDRIDREVPVREPNVVIVGVGLNDCRGTQNGLEVEPVRFVENLREIVRRCYTWDAQPVLCEMNPISETDSYLEYTYTHSNWSHYNEIIRRTASDTNSPCLQFGSLANFTEEAGMLTDAIHPSSSGHEAMYRFAVAQQV
jgi:lysophospholipase L1-like esterase